jgi:hypothetical protein
MEPMTQLKNINSDFPFQPFQNLAEIIISNFVWQTYIYRSLPDSRIQSSQVTKAVRINHQTCLPTKYDRAEIRT